MYICLIRHGTNVFETHIQGGEDRLDALSLRSVAVCCNVLQCVAVCCSVLQCVAVWHDSSMRVKSLVHMCDATHSYV